MSVQDNVRDRGRETVKDAGNQVTARAEQGKGDVADRLEKFTGSVRRSTDELRQDEPWLADLVERGTGGLEGLARGLRDRDLSSMAGDVQGFAKRNPAAFIGGALALGFVLGRVARTAAQRQGVVGDGIGAGDTASAAPPVRRVTRVTSGGIARPPGPEAARSLPGQEGLPPMSTGAGSLHERAAEPYRVPSAKIGGGTP